MKIHLKMAFASNVKILKPIVLGDAHIYDLDLDIINMVFTSLDLNPTNKEAKYQAIFGQYPCHLWETNLARPIFRHTIYSTIL